MTIKEPKPNRVRRNDVIHRCLRQTLHFRAHIACLFLSSILLGCLTSHGGQSGGVLVIGYTNGVPVTQVETNDYYRDKLSGGWEKKTPDVQLDGLKGWRTAYDDFSNVLVKEARAAGLVDADSLEKLLKKLLHAEENKGIAMIPVAVYQTQDREGLLWIIKLKWEVAQRSPMAHIRIFWFDRMSLKQLDFLTCG